MQRVHPQVFPPQQLLDLAYALEQGTLHAKLITKSRELTILDEYALRTGNGIYHYYLADWRIGIFVHHRQFETIVYVQHAKKKVTQPALQAYHPSFIGRCNRFRKPSLAEKVWHLH
ncbi:MAG: hypothetical protein Q7R56_00090 [Nanoarchaeota archaeon]|nr:hypothetical protein [Nanoarchaeota archaeon]